MSIIRHVKQKRYQRKSRSQGEYLASTFLRLRYPPDPELSAANTIKKTIAFHFKVNSFFCQSPNQVETTSAASRPQKPRPCKCPQSSVTRHLSMNKPCLNQTIDQTLNEQCKKCYRELVEGLHGRVL